MQVNCAMQPYVKFKLKLDATLGLVTEPQKFIIIGPKQSSYILQLPLTLQSWKYE